MRKINILLLIVSIILTACSGTKKTKDAISSGNYEAAFNNAVKKLTKSKSKYEKQIPLLKEAFDKEVSKDLATIKRLKSQKPADLENIYKEYMRLDLHQDEIILLQPLIYEGQEIYFDIKDYSKEITASKKKYADQLYNKAQALIYGSKEDSRQAHKILEDLQYVDPNYRSDLSALISTAKKRGSNFVFVKLHNKVANKLQDSTSQSILKSFSKIRTGDFKNKWIVLHNTKDYSVVYDYQADIYLDKITAIPEKTNTETVQQTKEIQTGWIYQKDAKGTIMKDANGNDIRKPKMEKVTAQVHLFQQLKSTVLDGKVIMKNLKNNTSSATTSIKGEAKLENVYATYKGEPKAIDQKYHKALQAKKATFPVDAEFNKFALQTFKVKVEQYLAKQQF